MGHTHADDNVRRSRVAAAIHPQDSPRSSRRRSPDSCGSCCSLRQLPGCRDHLPSRRHLSVHPRWIQSGHHVQVHLPDMHRLLCNANCNHHPSYCPATFCKKQVTKIPVPTPPPTEPPTSAVVPTAAPTPEPTMTPAPTCAITNAWQDAMAKNGGANYWGADQCHPIVCLGINKAWKDMTAEDLASPVLASQCTNCFCFGCNSTQFQPNCGGVAPTMAACTNRGCCPNNCLNGLGNIAKAKCNDPACADCAAGLLGMNCS